MVQKVEFWSQFPGLNSEKMVHKIFKKITMLHIVSRMGGPEKNKKYDTSGALFTGSSCIFTLI